ncbi:MAG: HesA/MoeB/ThiF family protein [Cardiobacteriaceae bacterium]|nr:HesA/MoeB/ThiF family protein [Cardiobacteriaceae bacterium]
MNHPHTPDFSRQLKVPGMTPAAQEKLARARVLVFGAGGLAASAVPWLAASGIGHLTLVDGDTVSVSNLHRQLPFTYADLSKPKAETLAAYCRARMAGATCAAIPRELDGAEILDALQAHDLALDCTDSRAFSYRLNDAALLCGKPVVFANASTLAGQLFMLHPGEEQPCWRCLWPEEPPATSATLGVLGPVPGVMGMLQALEALKILAGFAAPLAGEVLQYDFARLAQSRFAVPRAPDCIHTGRS